MSPTMLAALTRMDRGRIGIDLCRAKPIRIFSATAPLPAEVRRQFEAKYGIRVFESYGLSELLLITANDGHAGPKELSVGPSLPEVKISIRDKDGKEVGTTRDGDIFVRTPFASAGYIDFETGAPQVPAGPWFETGDVGHLDADGYLFVTGRVKDLIVRGGFNVSPRQVEEVLLQHPAVEDCAVVGIPHEFYGEQVVAAIIPAKAIRLEDAVPALRKCCKENLGDASVPDQFVSFEAFPVTNLGKVQKNKLRELISGSVNMTHLKSSGLLNS